VVFCHSDLAAFGEAFVMGRRGALAAAVAVAAVARLAAPEEPSFIYLLHIPKTAGQSLSRDLPAAANCSTRLPRFGRDRGGVGAAGRGGGGGRRAKPAARWAPDTFRGEMAGLLAAEGYDASGCNFYHAEGLYEIADDFRVVAPHAPARVATMVREPTIHLLSLYEHNRQSGFSTRRMAHTNYAAPSLAQWLEIALAGNSTQLGTQHNPFNMQTARLSGARGDVARTASNAKGGGVYPRKAELYRDGLAPDLDVALHRVAAGAWFVGVAEFYKESLCLFAYLATGALPADCACAASDDGLTHTRHGVPAGYADEGLPVRVLRKIDALTGHDRALYNAGQARFFKHVRQVERQTGKTIACTTSRRNPTPL